MVALLRKAPELPRVIRSVCMHTAKTSCTLCGARTRRPPTRRAVQTALRRTVESSRRAATGRRSTKSRKAWKQLTRTYCAMRTQLPRKWTRASWWPLPARRPVSRALVSRVESPETVVGCSATNVVHLASAYLRNTLCVSRNLRFLVSESDDQGARSPPPKRPTPERSYDGDSEASERSDKTQRADSEPDCFSFRSVRISDEDDHRSPQEIMIDGW